MELILIPVRADTRPDVGRAGESLIVDGLRLEFAALEEGAEIAAEDTGSRWIAGPVTRQGGVVRVPLLLAHGPDAPAGTRDPAPVILDEDGPADLPPWGGAEV